MAYKGAMKTLTINGNTYQVSGDGLTADVKEALLTCFEHVAWTDEHGQDYVDALEAALYPPATLVSISAVYTQSGTVYTTDSLDDLKSDLVVTAYYDDQSTATVTTYTLSGTLTEGTSVITVTYGGKTTTFSVTVTAPATLSSITAVYTQSGTVYDTDSLDSLKADLVVTAVYSDSTTQTVASTDYTLSGTLSVGTSTITVSYEGKTTTFSVTVSEAPEVGVEHYFNFMTGSVVDTIDGTTSAVLVSDATITANVGVTIGAALQNLRIPFTSNVIKKAKVKFGAFNRNAQNNTEWFLAISNTDASTPTKVMKYDPTNDEWQNNSSVSVGVTGVNAFQNGELIVTRNGNKVSVIFNGNTIINEFNPGIGWNYLVLGNGFYSFIVESAKTYTQI